MKRIRIVSKIAKWASFVFLVLSLWLDWLVQLRTYWHNQQYIFLIHDLLLPQLIGGFWFWKLAQLFRLYERGQIFSAKTILTLKTLGIVCAIGAVFNSIPFSGNVTSLVRSRMSFFSFDFGTGIDVGGLMTGIIVVLIAWIMDEGRKIQEEQELTV